ncbi:MAG: glycosyltransferase [Chitinophagaceae bacterium]|nr:glycosyltransferase [Chitinophagaceae bacterium]
MKKIKILYVGGLNANQKGAIGSHTSGVIKALKNNDKIDLQGLFFKNYLPNVMPSVYYTFDSTMKINPLSKIIQIIGFSLFFRKLIQKNQYDYVYFRFDPFFAPIISRKNSIIEYNDLFLSQIKFAASKNEWTNFGKFLRLSKFYRLYVEFSEKFSFNKSALIVVVTKKLKDYCLKFNSDNKVLILKNATYKIGYEQYERESDEYLTLGHIGTLTYWDGLTDLIYGMKSCIELFPECKLRLFLIGEGSMKNEIVSLVDHLKMNHIVFIENEVSYKFVPELYKKIDVVPLLKTIEEYGLSPIKFYEALAYGKSLIVTNIPHINELPDYAGSIVDYPLNIDQIALVLKEMFLNKTKIRINEKQIHDYAMEHHTWDNRIKELIKVLDA